MEFDKAIEKSSIQSYKMSIPMERITDAELLYHSDKANVSFTFNSGDDYINIRIAKEDVRTLSDALLNFYQNITEDE